MPAPCRQQSCRHGAAAGRAISVLAGEALSWCGRAAGRRRRETGTQTVQARPGRRGGGGDIMSTSFVIFSSTPPPLLLHPDTADTNKIIIPTTCPQLRCLPLGGRPKCYCIVNIVSRSFTHFFVHKKEKCFEIEPLVKKVKILSSLLLKVTKQQGNAVFMYINLDVE